MHLPWTKTTPRGTGLTPAPLSPTYLTALVAEIRILIRAVSGDPDQDLSTLEVKTLDGDTPKTLGYPQVVAALAEPATEDPSQLLRQIGLLNAARDALVRKTKPATGLSIAYTSLVSGNQRGNEADSTNALSKVAYGGIASTAWLHRWSIRGFCLLALFLAIIASWEATKASLGKSLLEVLEPLRAQQSTIAAEKFKLEVSLDKAAPPAVAGKVVTSLPVCDRYLSDEEVAKLFAGAKLMVGDGSADKRPHIYPTPEIRDLCGRDTILARNFFLAHEALTQYRLFWPDLVGGLYAPSARLLDELLQKIHFMGAVLGGNGRMSANGSDDIEFWVAPIVQVITSFILPFIFGVIGSLLYVILQHYNLLRTNLLVPRELALAYLRVILGIVVAGCISLLITGSAGPAAQIVPSTSGSTPPGSLVGSLTMSASLITFLAGFGAEAVFTLLHQLVQRVFAPPK